MLGIRLERPIEEDVFPGRGEIQREAERAVERLYDEFSGEYAVPFEEPDIEVIGSEDPLSGNYYLGDRDDMDGGYNSETNTISLQAEKAWCFRNDVWRRVGGWLYTAIDETSEFPVSESKDDFKDASEEIYWEQSSGWGDDFVDERLGFSRVCRVFF